MSESSFALSMFGLTVVLTVIPVIIFIAGIIALVVFLMKQSSHKNESTFNKQSTFQPKRYANGAEPSVQPQKAKKKHVNPANVMQLEEELKKLCKNCVTLRISGEARHDVGATRFGGKPDVPAGFVWPYFEADTFDDKKVKPRPLAFLAQFDLAEISAFDKDGILPRSGTLAFFYELGSQRCGFDPKDGGCAKVFWFHEWEDLSPAQFPEDLPQAFRLPALNITANAEKSYPTNEDFYLNRKDYSQTIDDFKAAEARLNIQRPDNRSKLLGWADVIQGNMTSECELIARGYTSDEVWNGGNFPKEELEKIEAAANEWTLLFQLDTVEHEGFSLMFGNYGRIYFYIRKDDLRAKRFDRIWLILQCG